MTSFFRAEIGGALLALELSVENDWKKMPFFEAESIEEVRKTVESDISRPTTSKVMIDLIL